MPLDGESPNNGRLLGRPLSFGDANKSLKFIGVLPVVDVPPFRPLDDAKGEMQIILEYPLGPLRRAGSPGLGDTSAPLGKLATSEKKNDVLTVGVLGVRGAFRAPRGVLSIEPKPPGENKPFAVGDCSQASTSKSAGV